MSSLNDSLYPMPDGSGHSFTPEESKRLTRKTDQLRDNLASTCRHLIQPPPGAPPWRRPRRQWTREAWRQYLDGCGNTLDDSVAVLPAELQDDEVKQAEADPETDAEVGTEDQ